MRSKLLLVAPILVLGLMIGTTAVAPRSKPTQPVLMTAATEPVLYTGPTTDSHAELTRALQKATDDWFRAMQAAREQEQAVAAAVVIEAARRQRPRAESAPSAIVDAPSPAPSSDGSAEDAVRTYFGDIFSQAWGVSGCESGHNPSAVSPGGGNWGLFQINTAHKKSFPAVTGHPWSDVLDPYLNAQFARWLYDNSGGWGPWSCKWAAR